MNECLSSCDLRHLHSYNYSSIYILYSVILSEYNPLGRLHPLLSPRNLSTVCQFLNSLFMKYLLTVPCSVVNAGMRIHIYTITENDIELIFKLSSELLLPQNQWTTIFTSLIFSLSKNLPKKKQKNYDFENHV